MRLLPRFCLAGLTTLLVSFALAFILPASLAFVIGLAAGLAVLS